MAPKKAAEAKKDTEKEEAPPAKKAKTEEAAAEVTPEADEGNEKEKDAPSDTRAKLKETIAFETPSTTLNVLLTTGGRLLSTLTDGGMQYLTAGARANTGVTAGRYFYEVRIVETLSPQEQQGRRPSQMPRQAVRLGFSVAGSSLFLGDGEGGICFDSEGSVFADGLRISPCPRFGKDTVIGLLVNLDPKSSNAYTFSLFADGERITPPQPVPEALRGKPLCPHVAYRNVTLHVHFGPQPLKALPFKCRTVQEASEKDVVVSKAAVPKDGKYEVLFPVGIPDEATFDWVDSFLEKHPDYVELSDRKIIEWAANSGLWKGTGIKTSNDRPEFNFGIPSMDDFSTRRAINAIASAVPRNFIVMEVKQNLSPADRKANLKRFAGPHFKKVAKVLVGEPNQEWKAKVQAKFLEEKKIKADEAWRLSKIEFDRNKLIVAKQKELEAKKKAALEAVEAAVSQEEKRDEDVKWEDVKKEESEAKEEPTQEADELKAKEEEEEEETSPPEVVLSEEEQKLWFRPPTVLDVATHVFSQSFADFTIPQKEEGFDEVSCEWANLEKSEEHLKAWIKDKKRSARVDTLQPSEWFKAQLSEWQRKMQEWQVKQREVAYASAGEVAAIVEDVFAVEDICNVSDGKPLFEKFAMEDWVMLTLRYEFLLLSQAYKRDVNDDDRPGMHESHLAFYYTRYYMKQLNPRMYGKETVKEVVDLAKDTVKLDDTDLLASSFSDPEPPMDLLVKLTEEARRNRQRALDAGDETFRLRIANPAMMGGGFGQPQAVQQSMPMQQPGAIMPYGGKGMMGCGAYGGKGNGLSVCRNFQQWGTCKFGATCRFTH